MLLPGAAWQRGRGRQAGGQAGGREEAEEVRVELIVCRPGSDGGYFSDVTGHQKRRKFTLQLRIRRGSLIM